MYNRRKKPVWSADGFKDAKVDYKDIKSLKNHITETGKIIPARITGVKAIKQRKLSTAIKRARYISMLPYCDKHQ